MADPSDSWTFLTSHALVLLTIADNPDLRLREIGDRVGVTERSAFRIVEDLVAGGYVERRREGRRNLYRVNPDRPLRHHTVRHRRLRSLLELLGD